QRELSRARDARAVYPRQEPLLAQPPDRMRRAGGDLLGAGGDDRADTLESVDQLLLAERRQSVLVRLELERDHEAQVQRRELERRPLLEERRERLFWG